MDVIGVIDVMALLVLWTLWRYRRYWCYSYTGVRARCGKERRFAELVQCLDDRSLSLIIRQAKNKG